jgi:hypothetical protein
VISQAAIYNGNNKPPVIEKIERTIFSVVFGIANGAMELEVAVGTLANELPWDVIASLPPEVSRWFVLPASPIPGTSQSWVPNHASDGAGATTSPNITRDCDTTHKPPDQAQEYTSNQTSESVQSQSALAESTPSVNGLEHLRTLALQVRSTVPADIIQQFHPSTVASVILASLGIELDQGTTIQLLAAPQTGNGGQDVAKKSGSDESLCEAPTPTSSDAAEEGDRTPALAPVIPPLPQSQILANKASQHIGSTPLQPVIAFSKHSIPPSSDLSFEAGLAEREQPAADEASVDSGSESETDSIDREIEQAADAMHGHDEPESESELSSMSTDSSESPATNRSPPSTTTKNKQPPPPDTSTALKPKAPGTKVGSREDAASQKPPRRPKRGRGRRITRVVESELEDFGSVAEHMSDSSDSSIPSTVHVKRRRTDSQVLSFNRPFDLKTATQSNAGSSADTAIVVDRIKVQDVLSLAYPVALTLILEGLLCSNSANKTRRAQGSAYDPPGTVTSLLFLNTPILIVAF